MVGTSKIKDKIESKTISSFDNNVIKYNTWFSYKCTQIIKKERDGYNEYLRSLFRAYLTCNDNEFVDSVKDVKRWRKINQGKLNSNYTYRDLMELGRVMLNNLIEEGT